VPAWAIALLFVAGEVALFIFIRDSLVLNFIGLVLGRPSPGGREGTRLS
jgi:hypothetical protein